MFESSLIDLGEKKKSRGRWISLPFAVGLHLALAASVGFAAYWHISGVAEPPVAEVFFVQQEPPAPGPETQAPSSGAPQTTPTQKPVVKPDTPVQPQDTPDDVPILHEQESVSTEVPVDDPGTGSPTPGQGGPGAPGTGGGCVGPVCGTASSGPMVVALPPPSDKPLPVGGAVTAPVATYRVQPLYTEMARKTRLQGTVIVRAVIDEEGRVINVQVTKGLPMGLDDAAVAAVRQWRFQPATLHGRAVKVFFDLTVRFEVQ
jgi:protein TonB